MMNLEKLMELDECIVTVEQLEEIEMMEEVTEVENNGGSGQHYGKTWYSVKLQDGEEIQVYC